MIKLVPIAMIRPNIKFVYAPSRIRSTIAISQAEFNIIANRGRKIQVSFEEDGVSNPKSVMFFTLMERVDTEGGGVSVWPGRYILGPENPILLSVLDYITVTLDDDFT